MKPSEKQNHSEKQRTEALLAEKLQLIEAKEVGDNPDTPTETPKVFKIDSSLGWLASSQKSYPNSRKPLENL